MKNLVNVLNQAWCLHVPHTKIRLCGVIWCERGWERTVRKREMEIERVCLYVYACVCAFPLWAYAETVSMQTHYWETHQEDENKLYCSTKWQTTTIKQICARKVIQESCLFTPFLKMAKCLFTVVDPLWCLSIFAHNGMSANLLRRFNMIYLINLNS